MLPGRPLRRQTHHFANHQQGRRLDGVAARRYYFNTSMDYLVGRSEIETRINAISENDLNRDEDFLLREFRSYDIDQQNAMLQKMESFKPY